MKTPGVFVTGTDTEVGKTVISAALAAVLRERNVGVGVMKPVVTGCREENGKLVGADTACLAAAACVTDPIETISPFSYAPPVAPTVAAEMAGEPISLNSIMLTYQSLCDTYEVMVVEGVGGIMVPIADETTVIDMVQAMDLPVVVVARPGLGTINHTLLTVHAAESAGLHVVAVVLNRYSPGPEDLVVRNNPREIARCIDAPVLTFGEAAGVNVENACLGTATELMRNYKLPDIVEGLIQ
ncbi:MAG: dethiobiotin synthase [Candidatus Hydrogenedentes bacterium]|nr:dethiobiotin synthase [Candidatus Hydrogenedentota bacterium]